MQREVCYIFFHLLQNCLSLCIFWSPELKILMDLSFYYFKIVPFTFDNASCFKVYCGRQNSKIFPRIPAFWIILYILWDCGYNREYITPMTVILC